MEERGRREESEEKRESEAPEDLKQDELSGHEAGKVWAGPPATVRAHKPGRTTESERSGQGRGEGGRVAGARLWKRSSVWIQRFQSVRPEAGDIS